MPVIKTESELRQAISQLSREKLEEFAFDVVVDVYGIELDPELESADVVTNVAGKIDAVLGIYPQVPDGWQEIDGDKE